jgi:RNA polymerase sigma-70 factor (ECF subfamily)
VPPNANEWASTRASLIGRVGNLLDQKSWREFFEIYSELIYAVARKAGLTDAEAQDVVQETMLAVTKHIPGFKYDPARGSFKAWLLNQTRWRIADQFRKRVPAAARSSREESTAGTTLVDRIVDPASQELDAVWETRWKQTLLDAAFVRARRELNPQKLQIFDFYVNHEWPPEKVAKTFGVTVEQVYLAKHRVTEFLKEEVSRLERDGV